MKDHTFSFEQNDQIKFADNFNVAVHFIDRHPVEGRSERVVIRTDSGEEVTYGQLAERVNRCGNALLGLGIAPGQRVLMIIKDAPEFYYVFWGAIKAGIVPVPLNTLLRGKDYAFMLEDSGCAAVIYSPEYASEVGPALGLCKVKPAHVILTEGEGTTLASLIQGGGTELAPAPAKATDDCFWLYSSGSTGTPKGTVHSQRDMAVVCHQFADKVLGLTDKDVCFSAAKLFFAYGLGNGMYFGLWTGGTNILSAARPTPDSTFGVIEKFKPTLYFGVPTLYAAQLQALEKANPDLSSVRMCVSAGEALPSDILRRWKERTGLDILDGIGSTEALHIFICNRAGDIMPGSSGKMVPGYQARIVDPQGNDLPGTESGFLYIKGDSTAKYYWNKPEKTAQTMIDGWLNTGDTYYRDEAGYYFYCGRNDDMLKVGGIWCSPFEIEAKLIEHPLVLEAAVVAQTDENALVKPAAYVVLTDQSKAGDEVLNELLQLCKKGLAPYKYPRWINFVEELPKTATGKIQRFRLRQA